MHSITQKFNFCSSIETPISTIVLDLKFLLYCLKLWQNCSGSSFVTFLSGISDIHTQVTRELDFKRIYNRKCIILLKFNIFKMFAWTRFQLRTFGIKCVNHNKIKEHKFYKIIKVIMLLNYHVINFCSLKAYTLFKYTQIRLCFAFTIKIMHKVLKQFGITNHSSL